jgi:hypothetical protein
VVHTLIQQRQVLRLIPLQQQRQVCWFALLGTPEEQQAILGAPEHESFRAAILGTPEHASFRAATLNTLEQQPFQSSKKLQV